LPAHFGFLGTNGREQTIMVGNETICAST
jgi:hypothetical protein